MGGDDPPFSFDSIDSIDSNRPRPVVLPGLVLEHLVNIG